MMFVVMSVVIAFLVFQVHQDGKRHIETKRIHQKQMEQIARLTIQSSTTVHAYLACENALEAKIKLEDIVETYGGFAATEHALGLKSGRVQALHTDVQNQYRYATDELMTTLQKSRKDLAFNIDEEAHLTAPSSSSSSRTSESRRRSKKTKRKSKSRSKKSSSSSNSLVS